MAYTWQSRGGPKDRVTTDLR